MPLLKNHEVLKATGQLNYMNATEHAFEPIRVEKPDKWYNWTITEVMTQMKWTKDMVRKFRKATQDELHSALCETQPTGADLAGYKVKYELINFGDILVG